MNRLRKEIQNILIEEHGRFVDDEFIGDVEFLSSDFAVEFALKYPMLKSSRIPELENADIYEILEYFKENIYGKPISSSIKTN